MLRDALENRIKFFFSNWLNCNLFIIVRNLNISNLFHLNVLKYVFRIRQKNLS